MTLYDRFATRAYEIAHARLTPELKNSHYEYAAMLRAILSAGSGRWLDLGCGHNFLPPWMPHQDLTPQLGRWAVAGIDLDEQAIRRHAALRHRVLGNIERLPFRDGAFDFVSANMVVEHVAEPAELFVELSRVLAPGGTLLIHTPNVQGYTTLLTLAVPASLRAPLAGVLLNRRAEDVYPTYYRANSADAIRGLANRSALAVQSLRFIDSSPQFIRIPPLMAAELLLVRLLRRTALAHYRPCILAAFSKPASARHGDDVDATSAPAPAL
jgi:SAM-dependent methyltransferase